MHRLWTILIVSVVASGLQAGPFTAPANSPLARKEHPRLFITAAGVPAMRSRIQNYYKSDFQQFVNAMDQLYSVAAGSGKLAEWNELFGAARSFALLYRLDPATVSGITAAHSRRDYGQKALSLGLHIAQRLPDDWNEAHHGSKNLTTAEGGLASLALQVVYDWTFDLATLEQRRQLADRLITLWNNRYDSQKVKLENHYAANAHVYAGALCFYGDTDLGAAYTTKAQAMMDSFEDVFLQRQLGVAERLFEGSSDWVEGDSYSMDGYVGIMLLAAAAGSAMGVNYFATNPWLHYAPYYLYYHMIPMPYRGQYYFSQQNTSTVMPFRDSATSMVMNMSAAMLQQADPNLAGFAAWFCERSPYGLDVDQYQYYESHLFDFFYKFVFGTRQVAKKSPEEAGIPLSVHLGQGHAMRSDHGANDATLIQFYSPKFWYANGHNEEDMGALNIHRFGPLAVSAANTKNGGTGVPRVQSDGKGLALNNILGIAGDRALSPEMGAINDTHDTPAHFVDGATAHIGTVEARVSVPGWHDYINYDYTRSYKGGSKAGLARRAVVYLRGPVNHEFVVVMDRVQSAQEKYFVLHTVGDVAAVDGSWQSAGSGHWTGSGRTFKVTNRIDKSHGQMYITSVLPAQATIHKFGGSGYEWVWADGSRLDYSASEFTELASFLLSDHTLQIRSAQGLFLTVMQLGDANTMGPPAAVENLSGESCTGVLLEGERAVIFSRTETRLGNFTYSCRSNKTVKHLLTELKPNRSYTVKRGGTLVASGNTDAGGTIAFSDNPGGEGTYSVALGGATAVEQHDSATLPLTLQLANHPNPFNPSTTLTFTLPQAGPVTLRIYNLAGQLVRTLLARELPAGTHQVRWDGTVEGGRRAASGVYLARIETTAAVAESKLLLAK
ncbi:MAG: T9SS type A sorting domain-containing protein [candidate division KSB1 bacterium]|nr:T9SS type A sorting domain-containing protein [candidate division KSB1 bacterium]MDZ7276067.1 T9SS type A sorting domain-containing protein [candidate division KSB1 bacterium]MDZ7285651.1 T9SS type A sorting domain-containing protein [candidate division KSB1 bacterium]MDZ7298683.1 T9SS type A sorting domain-containing protein [candidate division KSB1 bacterium]MDZ7308409.1 T9SS type A sorting domain-containing protein [candidate division KSB1 bacterium]